MHMYFALASLKAYLFDVLVWSIIGGIVLIICLALFKRTRLFLSLFAVLLILSSVPITVMSEISINGCCGAPSTGHEGLGYVIGAIILILGVGLLFLSKRFSRRQTLK